MQRGGRYTSTATNRGNSVLIYIYPVFMRAHIVSSRIPYTGAGGYECVNICWYAVNSDVSRLLRYAHMKNDVHATVREDRESRHIDEMLTDRPAYARAQSGFPSVQYRITDTDTHTHTARHTKTADSQPGRPDSTALGYLDATFDDIHSVAHSYRPACVIPTYSIPTCTHAHTGRRYTHMYYVWM